MATNFIQKGKDIILATATGLSTNDPYLYGSYLPCVLLTDASTSSPYNATVRTEGIFDLSVEAVNDSGNSAVTIGDMIFYTSSDTPKLNKKSTGKPFGIALEAVGTGETATIKVRLSPVYLAPEGIANADIADDTIRQTKMARNFILEEFESAPVCMQNDGTAVSGTNGETNIMHTEDNAFEYFIIGTQTLTTPTIAADGLLCSLDLTNNEGVEYSNGITVRSRAAFVVGTSAAFYAKCTLKVADATGSDICAFGFRKAAQAYQAVFADYTDKATLNKIGEDIYIETALNNGGDTSTDTTDNWDDGETHSLEVYVSAAGVVTYKIDGAAPTVTAAFTLDDTDTVVPFLHILHDATTPGAIHLVSWEVGLQ